MRKVKAFDLEVGDVLSDGRRITRIEMLHKLIRVHFDDGSNGNADLDWMYLIKDEES